MAQVKKKEVYDAILASAYALFRDKGYNDTTVAEIARTAHVSTSNIYVYFTSKLQILYAIYDPWLRRRIKRLAKDVDRLHGPQDRLRLIFRTL